jgi:hypothetical protein
MSRSDLQKLDEQLEVIRGAFHRGAPEKQGDAVIEAFRAVFQELEAAKERIAELEKNLRTEWTEDTRQTKEPASRAG